MFGATLRSQTNNAYNSLKDDLENFSRHWTNVLCARQCKQQHGAHDGDMDAVPEEAAHCAIAEAAIAILRESLQERGPLKHTPLKKKQACG